MFSFNSSNVRGLSINTVDVIRPHKNKAEVKAEIWITCWPGNISKLRNHMIRKYFSKNSYLNTREGLQRRLVGTIDYDLVPTVFQQTRSCIEFPNNE